MVNNLPQAPLFPAPQAAAPKRHRPRGFPARGRAGIIGKKPMN